MTERVGAAKGSHTQGCPETGCQAQLIFYENLNNPQTPRIVKFMSVDRPCDHWPAHGKGGGSECALPNKWLKLG